ncbi:MAG: hypothetical protein AB8G22_23915, partial [Saprospiraceae bacterium]
MKTVNIIFLLLAAIHLQAQSPTSGSSFLDQTAFKIGYYSYFGNLLINSGLSAGAEYAWKEKEKAKDGRKGQKTTRQQLLFHGNIGYSTNFTSQTDNGISADFGMIWRRTGSRR